MASLSVSVFGFGGVSSPFVVCRSFGASVAPCFFAFRSVSVPCPLAVVQHGSWVSSPPSFCVWRVARPLVRPVVFVHSSALAASQWCVGGW